MAKEMSQTYSRETQNATGFDGYVGSNWCPNNLDEQIFIEMYNDAVANGKEVKIKLFFKRFSNCLEPCVHDKLVSLGRIRTRWNNTSVTAVVRHPQRQKK
jgi:hypothetical protein